jgi:hypothetical protein
MQKHEITLTDSCGTTNISVANRREPSCGFPVHGPT